VGQIPRHKGVDLLVQAFKMVAPKHPEVLLNLIGAGKDDFRLERETEINAVGFKERVKFWGFREDATRLMRFAHIYVHSSPPSRCHESFGRSVVGAMAYSVPTVCFRSGALQEIVLPEQTGLICDERSEMLAKSISCMLQDCKVRDPCRKNARDTFEQLYSKRAVIDRWQKLFSVVTTVRKSGGF
jgi:glycosyltransferase involved in cell wall biosynthesis